MTHSAAAAAAEREEGKRMKENANGEEEESFRQPIPPGQRSGKTRLFNVFVRCFGAVVLLHWSRRRCRYSKNALVILL